MKIWNMQIPALMVATLAIVSSPLWANSFTDNSDGTVSDATTNLRWQKCSGTEAQGSISNDNSHNATCSGTAEITYTWANALNYCKNLTLAGKTWRLPSVNELKTIVDRGQSAVPFINQTAFPGTVALSYWSASTSVPGPTLAWSVPFSNGNVYYLLPKTDSGYVRCVSAGP